MKERATNKSRLTFAVITATIGRIELHRAIQSVANQTYPAKHYVFVDGEQFFDNARAILSQYPAVTTIYLPMNTGKDGWYNSRINAIAPFLVQEDIICYLDDDNFYQPDHIQNVFDVYVKEDPDYVYTFRNLIDRKGNFLCQDKIESLGHYIKSHPNTYTVNIRHQGILLENIRFELGSEKFIDVSCYTFKRALAQNLAQAWNQIGFGNDRYVFQQLNKLNAKGICTEKFSLNYQFIPSAASIRMCSSLQAIFAEHKIELTEQEIEHIFCQIVCQINNCAHILPPI
ncbi:glycosyl transferase family 2 [Bibersteinia trehalosi]|uniref:glycosyltransferase family 2 protein n=1 Tax=Bibersteinia trehalosi TaxID=47735 RepID=UPI001052D07A|nr:glycosyltransferase [Bibersteinia trehalosi]TCT17332.1 glycosyl transferase family 2 [Bibersteinia trehalosi]